MFMDVVRNLKRWVLGWGAFKNYVDRKGWVGGQSNVYANKVNDLFLFSVFVYKRRVGGQKSPKVCLPNY